MSRVPGARGGCGRWFAGWVGVAASLGMGLSAAPAAPPVAGPAASPIAGPVAPEATRPAAPVLARLVYGAALQGELETCGCKGALGGWARRVARVEALRREPTPLFLAEVGGLFRRVAADHPMARPDAGARDEFVAAAFGRLGLDALAFGPRDAWIGGPRLEELSRRAGLPWVLSNPASGRARRPAANPPGRVTPVTEVVVRRGGVALGFLALSPASPDLRAGDPGAEDLAAASARLRARGAEAVVLLSTLGLGPTKRRLAGASGVDVALIGASGERLARPLRLHGVPAVAAGVRGKYLGVVTLARGPAGVTVAHEVLPVEPAWPRQPAEAARVDAYLAGRAPTDGGLTGLSAAP